MLKKYFFLLSFFSLFQKDVLAIGIGEFPEELLIRIAEYCPKEFYSTANKKLTYAALKAMNPVNPEEKKLCEKRVMVKLKNIAHIAQIVGISSELQLASFVIIDLDTYKTQEPLAREKLLYILMRP